ncbi:uncharacterized protein LOC124555660 [Schistocerca americana]|uniref:uncharacterized protein LOC124555660 n=1 Tax=Schistocerca americana TaxID=7009 RepID=UPI001F503221|nr:uncharacterized protein LOC124555660 [Schistocerca americana]
MTPSMLPAIVALLATLCCPTAAHLPEPWPSCDLLYNWFWCRGHHEGGLICEGSFKWGSVEPVAVLWTRSIETGDQSHVRGQDDFGFLYNVINYEGHLKFSLRYCFEAERTYSESSDWHHRDPPPCKENWYNCDLIDDRFACQLRLCPWSHEPLLPLSGKVVDWYGCTKNGDQVDCYLSNLGERKIHHHSWPHVKHHDGFHEHLPHYEYAGMEPEYQDMRHEDL